MIPMDFFLKTNSFHKASSEPVADFYSTMSSKWFVFQTFGG